MDSKLSLANSSYKVVLIGVSAGGADALPIILSAIPDNFALPLIIVQHIHPGPSTEYMITSLNRQCSLIVKEADEKESIKAGYVYLAPANYHLLIEDDYTFSLSIDQKDCYCRPSINILFESAASVYRESVLAVVLTGANSDGSRGVKQIKNNHGIVIAQNPDEAMCPQMPRAAIKTGVVDYICPLNQIVPCILKLLKQF